MTIVRKDLRALIEKHGPPPHWHERGGEWLPCWGTCPTQEQKPHLAARNGHAEQYVDQWNDPRYPPQMVSRPEGSE
jgi:hypothetical protein